MGDCGLGKKQYDTYNKKITTRYTMYNINILYSVIIRLGAGMIVCYVYKIEIISFFYFIYFYFLKTKKKTENGKNVCFFVFGNQVNST